MKHYKFYILFILYTLCLTDLSFGSTSQKTKEFVVVIDPGHGGHDPGAVGKITKEKIINLNVALKLGNLIKQNCKDVKVIYTRNKDVFIPLARRAEIANDAKADLFISIHTNAVEKNKTVKGTSTWTLGLAKSDANLAVAQRENAVILYESDYKTRYAGFNPNSAESYIIFEFMQDKHMENSVHLASLVQKQFKSHCKRIDRGVHQAGFLVLKESAMPSILIELGFISTPEEERYLNTETGTSNLANGIYYAFLNYKREHEIRLTGNSQTIIPEIKEEDTIDHSSNQSNKNEIVNVTNSDNKSEIIFKVQLLTSSTSIKANDKTFKGIKDIDYYKEKGVFKYTTGATNDYNIALKTQRSLREKFKGAFIIAFKDGKRIDVNEAITEFKKNKNNN